ARREHHGTPSGTEPRTLHFAPADRTRDTHPRPPTLYQGHEGGPSGYITRINLDADGAHRVSVLAAKDVNGARLPVIDGSTWNPFAQVLLFTAETGNQGSVWQATLDYPSSVEELAGSLGRGGYEGIQNDSDGNLWIVEDVRGSTAAGSRAQNPNSFVYRFVPDRRNGLKHGKVQALTVVSLRTGQPIAFQPIDAAHPTGSIFSDDMKDLHTYGKVFTTRWVTIHDTATSTAPFDANALAKAASATPFKRPANGQFRPGSRFTEFFFDETGDKNVLTDAAAFGGLGSIMKLTQSSPSATTGTLRLFYLGDVAHTGLDNCAFWSDHEIVFVEDAGDTVHTQRNALDSAYLFDTNLDYGNPSNQPVRMPGLRRTRWPRSSRSSSAR